MPPAAPANVREMCKLLVQSRLVDTDETRAIYSRYRNEAGDTEEVDPFRKYLIQQKILTDYQAALLSRGHTEGFFLNDYCLLDRVGKGRMAGVYRAVHATGQIVAIKVLPPSKSRDPNLFARFQREAKFATQLNHPNIVRAYQLGEADGLHYIVMEYLEGETLQDVLDRRKRLPVGEAVRIVYQVLQGLQQVHERGIIHRDLKPSNLMLIPNPQVPTPTADTTLNCTVKILDIGLGRQIFDENAANDENPLTTEGVILGTPDYLAPEQARNASAVDIRADIYSLGGVLFHLLTGQPPFPDTNIMSQMLRHATEPLRPLSDFINPVPDGLQQVLNWMMAKDPNQRYPTPERAAQALQIFLMSSPGASPMSAMPSTLYTQALQSGQHTGGVSPAVRMAAIGGPLGDANTSMRSSRQTAAVTTSGATGANPVPSGTTRLPVPKPAPANAPTMQGIPELDAEGIPVGKLAGDTKKVRTSGATPRRKASDGTGESPAMVRPEDVDVELIPIPPPEGAVSREERPLTELDRRDIIMLAAGGGGVLFAILSGYALAQLVRRKEPPAESK
ncbi:serine/threonine-protein kinase [Tuwongella immobilis]|uniref:Protein kinase domain-containing protein n=1 Tax=Tuwongella immobilis TaxID=692036 RepID=A0A6C2YI53_9BACT|nr:serine/threonine-protein kinase [Tuwongella immobilis]VIP01107.1 serine threonine protein kinase : Serine/threonine protein kinase OS=Pirellula staleyi (strain ATCC 27377 / DSM 6068 / ICPB 4128) GN=Psta_0057 PE=4 SV=1: Pkinase [Tuwongella immobilis]VTR97639.1 serine threonine protein kinase : Serine/threonine protein kinase OS=Pirellula staleyi (strain ATCC 27377 / DSM 6068 / ICPB 4128) GN=Psta_0057 PE=4 SV=1: Pkinase [Tuwongella immobilis]